MSVRSKIIRRSLLTTFFVLLTLSCGIFPSGGEEKPGWSVTPRVAQTGDPITFTLTNTLANIITLPSTAPWHITNSNNERVVNPGAGAMLVPLAPGEKKVWVWNQQDDFGNQLLAGNYIAFISYYLNMGEPLNSTSTTFAIE